MSLHRYLMSLGSPSASNTLNITAAQLNTDGDDDRDPCADDNCRLFRNAEQEDLDGDGLAMRATRETGAPSSPTPTSSIRQPMARRTPVPLCASTATSTAGSLIAAAAPARRGPPPTLRIPPWLLALRRGHVQASHRVPAEMAPARGVARWVGARPTAVGARMHPVSVLTTRCHELLPRRAESLPGPTSYTDLR
jgi:hypothetical protein